MLLYSSLIHSSSSNYSGLSDRNTVSWSTSLLIAQNHFISCGFGLDSEIVFSTANKEVAIHAPSLSVRVSYDPIFGTGLVVNSPADNYYRMIEIHPCDSIVLQVTVSQMLLLFSSNHLLDLFMVLSKSTILKIRRHFGFMIV